MNGGADGVSSAVGSPFAIGTGVSPVLFFDARCGVCRRFISLAVREDRRGLLRIAPLQGTLGDQLREAYPQFAARESAIWVREGEPPRAFSDAILSTLDYLGGRWRVLARVGRVVPRRVRDWAYRTFARNRPHMGALSLPELDDLSKSRLLPDVRGPNEPGGTVRVVRLSPEQVRNVGGP